jgi:hypothetical protein
MSADTGPWVWLTLVGIVWLLPAFVIVASVVVGGRAERTYREAEDAAERTKPIYLKGEDSYESRREGGGAFVKGGRPNRAPRTLGQRNRTKRERKR